MSQGLQIHDAVFFMAIGWLLPSAERNESLCICILVHVCLLRGEMPVCKAIHLFASFATWRLSPGEAARGRGIIAVAVCPRLPQQLASVSAVNYFCTVATFLFIMVSASLHFKGGSLPLLSLLTGKWLCPVLHCFRCPTLYIHVQRRFKFVRAILVQQCVSLHVSISLWFFSHMEKWWYSHFLMSLAGQGPFQMEMETVSADRVHRLAEG